MKILSGKQSNPRRVLYHGTNWVGKSTWASQATGGCLIINLEDGLGDIDCTCTEQLTTFDGFIDALLWVYNHKNFPYQWLAVDTVDWLERLIQDAVVSDAKQKNGAIKSFGDSAFEFGRGAKLCMSYWARVMNALNMIRNEKKLGIILLSHSQSERINPPGEPSYDRWEPALHKDVRELLCDWVDEIFFGGFRTYVSTEDAGFNRKRAIGVGGQDRYVKTAPTAAVRAKNRLDMPAEIDQFNFSHYAEHFPNPQGGNISAVVVEGSSKKEMVTNG